MSLSGDELGWYRDLPRPYLYDRGVFCLEVFGVKPERKKIRLTGWDYSSEGTYFLTLCAKNRKPVFSQIVGRGILDAPQVRLSS